MTTSELIKEYETIMNVVLSQREIIIFSYAYTVGKFKLDTEEETNFRSESTKENNSELCDTSN